MVIVGGKTFERQETDTAQGINTNLQGLLKNNRYQEGKYSAS
tara:strand:- start:345 stop:470 length:126 start_codon:yes stop_codon:yes gene_type:complete